jgi:hypothetical protein
MIREGGATVWNSVSLPLNTVYGVLYQKYGLKSLFIRVCSS